jgi:hypothetical protein
VKELTQIAKTGLGWRNTDSVTNNTFFIGVYPGLSTADLRCIAGVFAEFMANVQIDGSKV